MQFQILGAITRIQRIAVGASLRDQPRLRRDYGGRRWRKLKGIATVRLEDGTIEVAELHWYEAHGIGRKETKIKRYLQKR